MVALGRKVAGSGNSSSSLLQPNAMDFVAGDTCHSRDAAQYGRSQRCGRGVLLNDSFNPTRRGILLRFRLTVDASLKHSSRYNELQLFIPGFLPTCWKFKMPFCGTGQPRARAQDLG